MWVFFVAYVYSVYICALKQGGLTLEVALSKWWSNASEATLDCTITFHGLQPTSRVICMVCMASCFISVLI